MAKVKRVFDSPEHDVDAGVVTITVNSKKLKKEGRSPSAQYNFGSNLEAMQEAFGDDVVFANARRNMIVTAQAILRRLAEGTVKENDDGSEEVVTPPFTDEELQEHINNWKPGIVTARGKSKVEKVSNLLDDIQSDEDFDILEQMLKERREAKQNA